MCAVKRVVCVSVLRVGQYGEVFFSCLLYIRERRVICLFWVGVGCEECI